MNIEIAERLLYYRKKNGYSQEQLAEAIGVSRQAVSKWERAEASPDTDNLIALSKLYNVSLDELMFGGSQKENSEKSKSKVHVGFDGIHVENENEKVHVGRKGIHVVQNGETKVDIDKNGVFVDDELKEYVGKRQDKSLWSAFPYTIIATAFYLVCGFTDILGGWGCAWIVFLTIPLYYSLIEAIYKRKADAFAFPVLVVTIYLWLGMYYNFWHPSWIIFLSVPVYYFVVHFIADLLKK